MRRERERERMRVSEDDGINTEATIRDGKMKRRRSKTCRLELGQLSRRFDPTLLIKTGSFGVNL